MRLNALGLRGFEVEFPEQMSCSLPGGRSDRRPERSGKSNISDSLQWAISAAPSTLRASAGTDVLFAGTDARPAAGVCEVELCSTTRTARSSFRTARSR